ncbi:hypothetical protein ACLOJK_003292, partial [Asimina triloba]
RRLLLACRSPSAEGVFCIVQQAGPRPCQICRAATVCSTAHPRPSYLGAVRLARSVAAKTSTHRLSARQPPALVVSSDVLHNPSQQDRRICLHQTHQICPPTVQICCPSIAAPLLTVRCPSTPLDASVRSPSDSEIGLSPAIPKTHQQ